jgi:predicted signal transduction protein with EAL and GGDEF domain
VASKILEQMASRCASPANPNGVDQRRHHLFCGASETVESVLMKADAAMYQAKTAGARPSVFDPVMQQSIAAQLNLQLSQRRAGRRRVRANHQSVGRDGAVLGAEALIRWQCGRA